MNTADLTIHLLGHTGVKYIFGVPGGAIEDLNVAIHDNQAGIKPIVAKHEAGAAFMADGFARELLSNVVYELQAAFLSG